MKEKTLKFGRHKHLVGISTIPDDIVKSAKRPAIIFINPGLLHHVGPFRLHVDLGRMLASDGFLTMRFDLSGIGDSLFAKGGLDLDETVKCDIQDAMDLIQLNYKVDNFVLVGLCSGATNAHLTTVADERISGLVMIDGFIFKTLGFYYREYKPYVINPIKFTSGVSNILIRQIRRLAQTFKKEPKRVNMFNRLPFSKQQIADDFDRITLRGVSMLCIYTGGISNFYNYPNQFLDMFDNVNFKGLLQLLYFHNADHLFVNYSERKILMKYIRYWISGNSLACSQLIDNVGISFFKK